MAIAANKVPGVRSAPIVDTDTAKLSREHNDLNVLTLGARVLPESRAREIVRTFLQTPFEGGRHATRVQKIHALESAESAVPSSEATRRAARRTALVPFGVKSALHHDVPHFLRRKHHALRHRRLAVAARRAHGRDERFARIPVFPSFGADEPVRRVHFVDRRRTAPICLAAAPGDEAPRAAERADRSRRRRSIRAGRTSA